MKYWRGYLVAAIFAAISWALGAFAEGHRVLVDMIYPYMSRLILTSLADWSSTISFCLWQVLLMGLIAAGLVTVVLMIILKWNPVQWFGWVCATVSCILMLNTLVYGLNAYAGPLADDIRLDVADYTVSELNETVVYFRDQANALAEKVDRDAKGEPQFGTFEDMAKQAADGFQNLTYEQAMSVFAGSTAPVKVQQWGNVKGTSGITVALTGESAVNPKVPVAAMPFAICKEMAHRMVIYTEADANFAAFLAGMHNSSPDFQYSAYLMAYYYSYQALASVPTSTAQACAKRTDEGVSKLLRHDLEQCMDFYGEVVHAKVGAESRTVEEEEEKVTVTFSQYSDVSDLLASWYIQKFIVPLHEEEEAPFDPFDTNQVDLSLSTVPMETTPDESTAPTGG